MVKGSPFISSHQACANFLKRFRDDRSGVIAMLFALVLVPILLTIGMSIDYGHATSYQSDIQRTLDEAAISGASELAKSGDAGKAEEAAKRRFDATKPTLYPVEFLLNVDRQRGTVQADARSDVPMTFMAIAGFTSISVNANAVASAKLPDKPGARRQSRQAKDKLTKMLSQQDMRDVIYRVEQVCYKLRSMGFASRVPQCGAVFDGSFEKKLRASLAEKGNAGGLLPGGVRLIK